MLTGAVDYISDGVHVVSLHNGNEILGQITGAGCIVGSCIASYCATAALLAEDEHEGKIFRGDMFTAAIAGYAVFLFSRIPQLIHYCFDRVLVLTVTTELAMRGENVKGPGTLLPGLIDCLWGAKPDDVLKDAKITVYS